MAVMSGDQNLGSAVNVPAAMGVQINSLSRSGNNVNIRFQVYMYQTTTTWSNNTWAIWVNNTRYIVHDNLAGKTNHTPGRNVKMWSQEIAVSITATGTSCNLTIGVNGNYWNPGGPAKNFVYTASGFEPAYTPVNPDMSISLTSSNVNNIHVALGGSKLVDIRSYTWTVRFYSDSRRTNQVFSKSGNNMNQLPFDWNGAIPGTTYYWRLDLSAVNSVTGGTLNMGAKTGSVKTMNPTINTESFTYTASPKYNNHWTPRTIISYSFTESTSSDWAKGLSLVGYDIQTALNDINGNTKTHRVTTRSGTIALTDLTKLKRAAKPRDLFYLKVRVVCVDNAGREYYSNWFGILTAQYIYNYYHIYLDNGSNIRNQLRVNTRIMFSNQNTEKYYNKGEVS